MWAASALDGAQVLNDASSIVVAAVVVIGAFKAHKWAKAEDDTVERKHADRVDEVRRHYESRCNRLRRNQMALAQYAGELGRMIPVDVERPHFPELLPEIDDL